MKCYRKGGCGPYEMTSCSECPYSKPQVNSSEKLADELSAYRTTGLSPAEVADLAKAKADGRLVVVPCKVGDTVYACGYPCSDIKCEHFHEGSFMFRDDDDCNLGYGRCPHKIVVRLEMTDKAAIFRNCFDYKGDTSIGKTVFLTLEEAEAVLRKEQG